MSEGLKFNWTIKEVILSTGNKKRIRNGVFVQIGKDANSCIKIIMEMDKEKAYNTFKLIENIKNVFYYKEKIKIELKMPAMTNIEILDSNQVIEEIHKTILAVKRSDVLFKSDQFPRIYQKNEPKMSQNQMLNTIYDQKISTELLKEDRKRKRTSFGNFRPMNTLTQTPSNSFKEQPKSFSTTAKLKRPFALDEKALNDSSSDFEIEDFNDKNEMPKEQKVSDAKEILKSAKTSSFSFKTKPPPIRLSDSFLLNKQPFSSPLQKQGFRNLGNTCYLNATLQALLILPDFRKNILKLFNRFLAVIQNRDSSILFQLGQVLMKQETSQVVDLTDFKTAFDDLSSLFKTNEQQDADEFMKIFLDKLNDEIYNYMPNKNHFSDPFCFEMQNETKCDACGHISISKQTYRDLPLSFSEKIDRFAKLKLDQLLEQFFQPHPVAHLCEKCSSSSASSQYKMLSYPKYFVLQLKRFGFDMKQTDKLVPTKITNTVLFKEEILIGNYLLAKEGTKEGLVDLTFESDEENFNPNIVHTNNAKETSFKLWSLISHLGDSSLSGHYVCDVWKADQKSWFCFDDAISYSIGEFDSLGNKRASNCYLFFYALVT